MTYSINYKILKVIRVLYILREVIKYFHFITKNGSIK